GLSVVTAPIHALRFGAELALGGTARSDSGSTAAAHAVAELSRSFARWGLGIGAGPSTGLIAGDLPVTALHTRARVWWRPESGPGAPELQLSVEPTRFPDGWFTDASLIGTMERGRATVSLWAGGRVRMAGARSVAIAGDWNSWEQVPLRPLGDDVWEGVLGLRRGLYHFNLLVDGSDWVVPNGVATVPDGLGGMVAVLIVP